MRDEASGVARPHDRPFGVAGLDGDPLGDLGVGQWLASEAQHLRVTPDAVGSCGRQRSPDRDHAVGEDATVSLGRFERPPGDDHPDHAALGRVAAGIDIALRACREDGHATHGLVHEPTEHPREIGAVEDVVRAKGRGMA
jgi:hypothetical protein